MGFRGKWKCVLIMTVLPEHHESVKIFLDKGGNPREYLSSDLVEHLEHFAHYTGKPAKKPKSGHKSDPKHGADKRC